VLATTAAGVATAELAWSALDNRQIQHNPRVPTFVGKEKHRVLNTSITRRVPKFTKVEVEYDVADLDK
jgi:hypothetical protein